MRSPFLSAVVALGCYGPDVPGPGVVDGGGESVDGVIYFSDGASQDGRLVQPCEGLTLASGCFAFDCGDEQCHLLCRSPVYFGDAVAACAGMGVCLATVDSVEENNCFGAQLNYNERGWIGLSQLPGAPVPEADWVWSCGTTAFDGWGAGEPNDYYPSLDVENNEEDCAALENYHWLDIMCSFPAVYFCDR